MNERTRWQLKINMRNASQFNNMICSMTQQQFFVYVCSLFLVGCFTSYSWRSFIIFWSLEKFQNIQNSQNEKLITTNLTYFDVCRRSRHYLSMQLTSLKAKPINQTSNSSAHTQEKNSHSQIFDTFLIWWRILTVLWSTLKHRSVLFHSQSIYVQRASQHSVLCTWCARTNPHTCKTSTTIIQCS